MMQVRHAEERGLANLGWLNSRHTFSFGHYYDPSFMGFGALRVINEDRVQPAQGFGAHGHQDMEIISYVLGGALEHKDSMGNGSVIRPGDVQRMSAGTGVRHSEYNHSDADLVHFLQIWIVPETTGLEPSHEQITVPREEKRGKLRLIGSRDARDGSVRIHQDVDLFAALLQDGESVSYSLADRRRAWVQVATGRVWVNDQPLEPGDGVAITGAGPITIGGTADAEILLFDLT